MDPRYERVLVVANPISGRGQAAKAAGELHEGLRRRGVHSDLFLTRARGDAFTHLRNLGGETDLVVAVGGDGTLREVLEGLVDPAIPVAILPFGTANVLAMELGLPRDVHHHLEILSRGHTQTVDVAKVNGHLSVLATGVGLDAMAVREVEARRTGPITKWTYVQAGLRALRTYHPPRLQVTADGEELGEVGLIIVANAFHYGGVRLIKLAEDARHGDGLFEVYLFPTGKLLELASAFVRGVVRHLPGGAVSMRRAKNVRIESEEPIPYHVDGDLGGTTPVEIEISPNQYSLVVP